MQQVAQIIQVASYLGMSRQIFYCSVGGFDTHAGELATHTALYPQVSQALAAFYTATQEMGVAQNVTTFTESDFSRTFQPTSGDGSDHAWGSHQMVMGGRGARRADFRHVPDVRVGRAGRYGHARAMDSDDGDRSVRGDAGFVVRRAGLGADFGLPEFRKLRGEEVGVPGIAPLKVNRFLAVVAL